MNSVGLFNPAKRSMQAYILTRIKKSSEKDRIRLRYEKIFSYTQVTLNKYEMSELAK